MKITLWNKGKKKTIIHGLGDKALKQYEQKPVKILVNEDDVRAGCPVSQYKYVLINQKPNKK